MSAHELTKLINDSLPLFAASQRHIRCSLWLLRPENNPFFFSFAIHGASHHLPVVWSAGRSFGTYLHKLLTEAHRGAVGATGSGKGKALLAWMMGREGRMHGKGCKELCQVLSHWVCSQISRYFATYEQLHFVYCVNDEDICRFMRNCSLNNTTILLLLRVVFVYPVSLDTRCRWQTQLVSVVG